MNQKLLLLLVCGAALFALGLALVLPARSNLVVAPWTTAVGAAPTGSCSQSTAYFARVWAAPATLDTPHVTAYDNTICALVTHGVFAKLDNLWILATQHTAAAKLNLTSSSYTLTENGSPSFSPNNGYTGAEMSTTIFLDTHYNPSTNGVNYTANVATFGVWVANNLQSGGSTMGANDGTTVLQMIPRYTTDEWFIWINVTPSNEIIIGSTPNSSGLNIANRTGINDVDIIRNTTVIVHTNANGAALRPNAPVYILNGSGATLSGSPHQVMMAFVGGGLSSTNVTDLYNDICNNFLTPIHGSCP